MLQAQCELWSGPIAAVVYVPLLNGKVVSMDDASVNGSTRDAQHDRLALFHDRVTKEGLFHALGLPAARGDTCNRLWFLYNQQHSFGIVDEFLSLLNAYCSWPCHVPVISGYVGDAGCLSMTYQWATLAALARLRMSDLPWVTANAPAFWCSPAAAQHPKA